LGLASFILQELPYIIMAGFKLGGEQVMAMTDKSATLNIIEKVCGTACIVLLPFLVRDNSKWDLLESKRGIAFLPLQCLRLSTISLAINAKL
jgi:hypothetical protein